MKKIYSTLIAFGLVGSVAAQCVGNRYRTFEFTAVDATPNIQYGSNINLQGNSQTLSLDVYEPQGDIETSRPLVILIHGGSFVGGSRTGTDVVPLCQDLAKLGYVTSSIQYRLGMAGVPLPGPDSVGATESVVRAYHDLKAAIRFFKKDVTENGNTYGVDTNNIFIAGVSAGGITAVHVAYMDELSEMPSYVDYTKPGLGGGLEGLSGNVGYSSDFKAVINIAGALRDTTWMKTGDKPILSLHGDNDGTVPYGTSTISMLGIWPIMEISGSHSIHEQADRVGIVNCLETHEGQGHVPHVNNASYYDTTLTFMRNFLLSQYCNEALDCFYNNPLPLLVSENDPAKGFNVYPNPSKGLFTLELNIAYTSSMSISITDMTGREVYRSNLNNIRQDINLDLASGVYHVSVVSENQRFVKKLIVQ
ncbi:MAG: T9SS type A sorting domain-containing protein [Flavobacteriales bacterium]